jgi:predicted SnoaL-like aldol condensation-catalyzing enzyme
MSRRYVLLALVVGAAPLWSQQLPPYKQLVVDFFEFRGTREERAARFMTADYVQHNPRFLQMDEITGARGSEAWIKAGEEAARRRIRLVDLGGIPLRNPIVVMAEGDLVFGLYRGALPDPAAPGRTYEAFAFEAWRMRDGKFAEHWDQVRLAPGWMTPLPVPTAAPGGTPPGATGAAAATVPIVPEPSAGCAASPEQLAANKRLVLAHFEREPARTRGRTRELLLADCDFVSIVWKETLPDPDRPGRSYDAFTFDTFRVRDGRLAEHWDERQR